MTKKESFPMGGKEKEDQKRSPSAKEGGNIPKSGRLEKTEVTQIRSWEPTGNTEFGQVILWAKKNKQGKEKRHLFFKLGTRETRMKRKPPTPLGWEKISGKGNQLH